MESSWSSGGETALERFLADPSMDSLEKLIDSWECVRPFCGCSNCYACVDDCFDPATFSKKLKSEVCFVPSVVQRFSGYILRFLNTECRDICGYGCMSLTGRKDPSRAGVNLGIILLELTIAWERIKAMKTQEVSKDEN